MILFTPEVKGHLIFSAISILQQKRKQISKMWVVDARYLWFVWAIVFILSKWSQHLETVLETTNANDVDIND